MNKHTQGPWHVDFGLIASSSLSGTKRIAVLVDQKQKPIDFPIIDDGEFEEELANARLIAAAPQLLIAAKMALETIKHACLSEFDIPQKYLEEAIKKAKGN